ncbi:MAG: hypothetical protein B6I36_05270 [Desulfobacteraceae bacterium 4572_35.1]|nr:MAG: hypothetical protein B6I36_05270 [Desulfobacteraceae bacterium 4572_35.1]
MKYLHLLLVVLLATTLGACKDQKAHNKDQVSTIAPQTTVTQSSAEETDAHTGMTPQVSGTVLESMDTAGYTYVKVKTDDKEIWAAAPQFKVAVGDAVIIPAGMVMPNYHSNTLNRDFKELYFVSNIIAPNAAMDLNAHENIPQQAATSANASDHIKAVAVDMDFSSIIKADHGYTIAEIFAKQDDLATKEITLRAKVVKFSPNIMKTNWVHLQDGSGADGTNDLTITTKEIAAVGDTVLVKGILDLNQDFGYGYKYAVIIQNAKVAVE